MKRSFVTKQTEVTLTANSKGTTLTAEYDTDSQVRARASPPSPPCSRPRAHPRRPRAPRARARL